MRNNKNKSTIVIFILVIIVLVLFALLIFTRFEKKDETETTSQETVSNTETSIEETTTQNITAIEPTTEAGQVGNVQAGNEASVKFKDVNENVTAKQHVNMRSSMNQEDDSNVIDVLYNGTTVIRTGIADNGWSRLSYNGRTVYAVSSYLTTDLNAVPETETQFKTQFKAVTDTITAKELTNLRDIPSTKEPSKVVYQLKKGENIQRTGISEEYGWSRVIYNGQILYAVTSYLEVVPQ